MVVVRCLLLKSGELQRSDFAAAGPNGNCVKKQIAGLSTFVHNSKCTDIAVGHDINYSLY